MTNRLKDYVERVGRPETALRISSLSYGSSSKQKKLAWGLIGLVGIGVVGMVAASQQGSNPGADNQAAAGSAVAPAARVTHPADTPLSPPSASAAVSGQADALVDKFKEVIAPCDSAGDAVQSVMKTQGSAPDEIYSVAKTAQQVCYQTHLDLFNKLHTPPGADPATAKAFDDALDRCQVAYYGKEHSYEALAAVIDDQAPSKVAKFKELMSETNEAMDQCVSTMRAADHKAGGKAFAVKPGQRGSAAAPKDE